MISFISFTQTLHITCAEKQECLLHSRSGEDGIEKLMLLKVDMPSLPHLQHPPVLLLLWLEVIKFKMYQNSHLLLTTSLVMEKLKNSSLLLIHSELVMILAKSEVPKLQELEEENTETPNTL